MAQTQVSHFPNWLCSQIGAREHYAIPRALHRAGVLGGLFTDFWAGTLVRKLANKRFSSLSSRWHPDLKRARVKAWNFDSLFWEARLRYRSRNSGMGERFLGFAEFGRQFSSAVKEELKHGRILESGDIFFSYDTSALETLEFLREHGVKSIVCQMDPNRVELGLVREEEKNWPEWVNQPIDIPEAYFERREREWCLADIIMVNSQFCHNALVKQGVFPSKIIVVPLCYEPEMETELSLETTRRGPLKVLWLGQVVLRKGIQYLMKAAREMQNEHVRFDIVGPIGISAQAIKSAPKNMFFHGRANRSSAAEWYRKADLFVLPTISDGFAITQIEAMAYGLPVVATPNCGKVISDGEDGYIVPPRDVNALVQALGRYIGNPDLLNQHRINALKKCKDYSLSNLGANLLTLGHQLTGVRLASSSL